MTDARALFDAGRLDEAAAECRACLARDVGDLDALHLLGVILLRQGAAAEAVPLLAVVAESRTDAAALNDLGEALDAACMPDEAEARFRAAIALDTTSAASNYNLGRLLLLRGANAEAVTCLRHAVALRSEFPEAWFLLGNALLACDDPPGAEECYRAAITLRPNYVEALSNLGNVQLARHRADDAAACYRDAVALRPEAAELRYNLGNALLASEDAEAAVRSFRVALTLRPDFADAANNLGLSLMAQHSPDEAFEAFGDALRLDPANHDHRYNYALCLLQGGRFEEGWQQHEVRRSLKWMQPDHQRRTTLPQWRPGSALEGRRVLLMKEQGFGDLVQFVRYAPLLAARGASVVLELPHELHPPFASLSGVERLIGLDDPASDCDIGCPLMSLPLYFGTTLSSIPADLPYASVLPERHAKWRAWLGPPRGRRIGLACSGRPIPRDRSIPLLDLAPLFDAPDCEFFLLQPELREQDAPALAAMPNLRWPGPLLGDFGDTAALLAEMDLVVTVDTAVAHLAGALARPVWLMLHPDPDWRWMLHRPDSPWYSTMTLYRRQRRSGWNTVVDRVRHDLCALT